MKKVILFAQFIIASFYATAQTGSLRLTGITTDSAGKPAPGVTVEILNGSFKKSSVANLDGSFSIDGITSPKEYTLNFTAIGFTPLTKKITITGSDIKNAKKDIGAITLQNAVNTLANVVVTTSAAPPTMQFGIDRKIFNVTNNITAQGGTAVDVMKNIPSLSVDVNGNVQLRNNTPQILIDGRPTILTLDQIPADDIEKVELVTNPSARYDASSAAGIINIVMKKNKRAGLNGIASVSAGTPELLNGNLNLNLRQDKFNIFASGNYNSSGGARREETYRENKSDGIVTDYFKQSSENKPSNRFSSVRFGTDYFIDKNTTLSFTQSFNSGNFKNTEIQDQQYFNEGFILNHTGLRTTTGTGNFNRSSSRLSFDKKFNRPDHTLTADITYNSGNRDNSSFIINTFTYPDGSEFAPDSRVRNSGASNNYQVVAQADYSNKINDNERIEFGLRSFYNNSTSTFGTYSIDASDNETKLPLSNDYKYTESVNAGYFNYANKWKSITYQVGLRAELSKFDGLLIDSNYSFGYKYPDGLKNLGYALFPSVFLTKELNENNELQLNYSKRIRRPMFWEVNPFADISDPMNIRIGNPALKPEYTNSFELNYFNRFKENKGSFLAVLYFQNNVGDVTQYSDTITDELYNRLSNAAVSPDAIVNTFINAGHTNRMGAEFTVQQKWWKNFDVTYNANFQYRSTKASIDNLSLDNSGFNFQTKLITNYKIETQQSKLFNNLSFQLIADYEGPRVIPQGKTKAQFVSDFAMRKEFLKRKAAALSFSVNDILNTRKFGTIYDTDSFYQDSYQRWSVRTFRVTFSYKFGDSDLDLFKRKNNNHEEDRPGADLN